MEGQVVTILDDYGNSKMVKIISIFSSNREDKRYLAYTNAPDYYNQHEDNDVLDLYIVILESDYNGYIVKAIDNDEEFRVSLRLRITNDFVMALLSRSASLTVIKPLSLRTRLREIYKDAIQRNN